MATSTVIPVGVLSPDSPFYRPLPTSDANRQKASNSDKLVANLVYQVKHYWSNDSDYNFTLQDNLPESNNQFSQTLRLCSNADPLCTISSADGSDVDSGRASRWFCTDGVWASDNSGSCQNPVNPITVNGHPLPQFPIPADVEIPTGTDRSVTLYNVDTREYLEMWAVKSVSSTHYTCQSGGYIPDASVWDGRFYWPFGDSREGSGTCAVGAAMVAFVTRIEELLAGEINHPVGIGLVDIYNRRDPSNTSHYMGSYPGTRHDGNTDSADVLTEGQYLYLPASLDLGSLHLHPFALTVAKAAQRYGLMVVDKGGSCGMNIVNPAQYQAYKLGGANPTAEVLDPRHQSATLGQVEQNWWSTTIFNGKSPDGVGGTYAAFPFDKLIAGPLDWHLPATTEPTVTQADAAYQMSVGVLPQKLASTRAEIDVAKGLAYKALAAAKAGGGTGTGTAAATTTVAPVAGGTLTLN